MPYFVEPNEPLDLVSPDNPLVMRTGVNKGNVIPESVVLIVKAISETDGNGLAVTSSPPSNLTIVSHDLHVVCDTYPPMENSEGNSVSTARIVGYIECSSILNVPTPPPAPGSPLYMAIDGTISLQPFNPGCTAQGSFNVAIEYYAENIQSPVFSFGNGVITTDTRADKMFVGESMSGIRLMINLLPNTQAANNQYFGNVYRLWFY